MTDDEMTELRVMRLRSQSAEAIAGIPGPLFRGTPPPTDDPRFDAAVFGPRPDLEYELSFCRCCPEVAHVVYPECYHWYTGCEFGKLLEIGDGGPDTILADSLAVWLIDLTGYTRSEFIAEFDP